MNANQGIFVRNGLEGKRKMYVNGDTQELLFLSTHAGMYVIMCCVYEAVTGRLDHNQGHQTSKLYPRFFHSCLPLYLLY